MVGWIRGFLGAGQEGECLVSKLANGAVSDIICRKAQDKTGLSFEMLLNRVLTPGTLWLLQ